MDELYARVSKIAKQSLYQFMKDEKISLLKYSFQPYFDDCIKENEIKVTSHHFSNHKIEGLTIMDSFGISISYEKDNPEVKQNFTLCHELGHFLLRHEGTYFTETADTQEISDEREANIFSAVILMPDIVLLSKIYYSCDTFEKVQVSLGVSKQALHYRLVDLLREFFPNEEETILSAIELYREGQNPEIHHYFDRIKELVIEEYDNFQPSLVNKVRRAIRENDMVTSQEIPSLLNEDDWDLLKTGLSNVKVWLLYNRGKTIAYAWDKTKLSDQQARKRAELKLLLM
ncbi:ImmA/IrrE family metallo-endopeptidase [Streptococcus uberis]|uniref:ImmA/IrrE family metallo-endopeptidase n=1 Tax=Streptococcus uberis TaxID=1349 RepID=UPI0027DACE92|nr:ImmA/IrrE family metallo-endopeptidase [Streptococcus uberis]MCK1238885.1 ImmA/IrrE family metallo-endopeptidase [Streptococcus uberis]